MTPSAAARRGTVLPSTRLQLLLLGTLALAAVRVVLSLVRTGPLVVADEAGYLLNARVLAGGVHGQLTKAPFYRGGYSIVLAPLLALHLDPTVTYRLILVLNALLAASLAPLLYLLLTRSFRVESRFAVWPALAAAAYPSVTLWSQVALSENLLLPLVVVWLIAFASLLDASTRRSSLASGAAVGACTIALYAVHGRMIVAVALTGVALVLFFVRGRVTALGAAAGLVVIATAYPAVRALNDHLISSNYGGVHHDEAGQRLSSLGGADSALAVVRNVVGQLWYVLVATLGVLVVFAVAGGLKELGRIRRREAATPVLLFALLLTTLAGLLAVSAMSFPGVERPDMFIYGRYVEVVVPPLLALALARLTSTRRELRIGAALVALGAATALVVVLRLTIHPAEGANRWNVASLPFPTFDLGIGTLAGAAVVASGAAVIAIVLLRRSPVVLSAAMVVLFVPTTAVVERNPAFSGERYVYPSGWTSPRAASRPAPASIAYDMSSYDIFGLYAYQWFLPHSRFVLFRDPVRTPPANYVISSKTWGSRHPRLHAVKVWSDPGRDQALYELQPS